MSETPIAKLIQPTTAANVAERWKAQYCHNGKWGGLQIGGEAEIYERVKALPETSTAAEIDAAVGHIGWATHWCDECHGYTPHSIQIGDEPDYESATVELCPACARRLLDELTLILAEVPA